MTERGHDGGKSQAHRRITTKVSRGHSDFFDVGGRVGDLLEGDCQSQPMARAGTKFSGRRSRSVERL
jgi:hypothetical protein